MSTKKFQFVVVVNSSVLFHRLPVCTTGEKKSILQYKQGLSNRLNLTSIEVLTSKANPVAVYNLQVSEGWVR